MLISFHAGKQQKTYQVMSDPKAADRVICSDEWTDAVMSAEGDGLIEQAGEDDTFIIELRGFKADQKNAAIQLLLDFLNSNGVQLELVKT